jgi:predicted dehydrogenase
MAFERLHLPAYRQLADRYELVALCDTDPEKARTWAERLNLPPENVYADWQALVRRGDLDVVDIIVPVALNFTVTEGVARALSGRQTGIVCEKPLAPDLAQAEAARELPRKYGVPILIAENYRYNQEVNLLRDLVRTKRIGDIWYFLQNRVMDFPGDMVKDKFAATEWRQHADFPGGVITDTAVHDLAALRCIFGALDRIQAFGHPQAAGFAPYAVVQANLRFKSGITGQFTFFCAGKEMQRPLIGLRLFGTEGMIYLEERDCGVINLAYNDGRQEQIPYQPQQGYYNEFLNLYNALTGSEPLGVPPEVEYGDLKTVQDLLRSIREERIIAVDEAAEYDPVYS